MVLKVKYYGLYTKVLVQNQCTIPCNKNMFNVHIKLITKMMYKCFFCANVLKTILKTRLL